VKNSSCKTGQGVADRKCPEQTTYETPIPPARNDFGTWCVPYGVALALVNVCSGTPRAFFLPALNSRGTHGNEKGRIMRDHEVHPELIRGMLADPRLYAQACRERAQDLDVRTNLAQYDIHLRLADLLDRIAADKGVGV